MVANNRRGLTLVEVVVASALFSMLVVFATRISVNSLILVENQTRLTDMDRAANKALREMSRLLKAAILPYKPGYLTEDDSGNGVTVAEVFADINHKEYGFGHAGNKWESELRRGMDSIAFVVPVDAQGADDLTDSNGLLQIGYEIAGTSYLSASASGTPNSKTTGFKVRAAGELVSALAAMDPEKLNSEAFEALIAPTDDDWRDLTCLSGKTWPDVTCFMALRFVPVRDKTNNPFVLYESRALNGFADVDLDGDDAYTGAFQVGCLQLVYSGGQNFYCVRGGSVVSEPVEQTIVTLTPNAVLRNNNPDERTPIFRLESLRPGGLSAMGGQALSINMLFISESDIDFTDEGWRKNTRVKSLSARRSVTSVLLKNMALR